MNTDKHMNACFQMTTLSYGIENISYFKFLFHFFYFRELISFLIVRSEPFGHFANWHSLAMF